MSNTFKVKNGLSIGGVDIIDATGHWIGPPIEGTGGGSPGPQGPQGFQGSSGTPGLPGIGVQGSQGYQGYQGPSGGAQGPQGFQGRQGSQGNQGNVGINGTNGVQGAQGSTGPQGVPGGSQGYQGFQGNQGFQGTQGNQGFQSSVAGPQGYQGFQGPQGYQGFQGNQGFQSSIAGPQGYQGPQGFQGNQGFQSSVAGPQGYQGDQGVQGSQGYQGNQGFQGNQGYQGNQGFQGNQGYQGPQGFQGNQGFQSSVAGPQGAQGTTGSTGPTGPTGSTGPQGAQGTTGSTGPTGPQGAQGNQGYQGPIGSTLGNNTGVSWGQLESYGTYTNFNSSVTYWGFNYVQGNTNAPNSTSSQWYRGRFSLGSGFDLNYAGNAYWLELTWPRYSPTSAGHMWARTAEGGSVGSWTQVGANIIGTGAATSDYRAPIFYDYNNTGYYWDGSSTSKWNESNQDGWHTFNNYGLGITGAYNSYRLQTVFAMGSSYRMQSDGNATLNMYGIAWSHPNAGSLGGANNLNDHGILIINNGSFRAAISSRAVFSADVRGTMFYDYNDTNYYCDPNSNSNFVNLTAGQIYANYWFRNYGVLGLYNETYPNHWYADSTAYWSLAGTNNIYCGIRFRPEGHQSTVRGYVYADTSNNIGFLGSDGNWKLRVVSNDYSLAEGSSMRAQLYYDYNDTGYYCDPNSTSWLNTIYSYRYASTGSNPDNSHPGYGMRPFYSWNIGQANNASSGYSNGITVGSHPGDQAYGFQIVQNMWDDATYTRRYNGGWQSWYKLQWINSWMGSSLIHEDGRHYATVLYDSNDTGYYCDPNSTSRMYRIDYNNLYSASDTSYGFIGNNVYADTINSGYSGDQLELNYVRGTFVSISHDSMRAPLFYDYNNTGYYCDPASTTQLSYVLADNWFRPQGGCGVWWESYGRGIRAADNEFSHGNIGTYGSGLNGWRGYGIYPNNCILMSDGNNWGVYRPGYGWMQVSDMSGNVTFSGNVTAYSDLRLKENVREIDNVIERRNALAKSAIKYERDGVTKIGYGAQTLMENGCKEFVKEEDDSRKLVTGLGTLSVSYGETSAVLAVVSKLTDDRVVALEAKILELEEKISKLMEK